MLLKISCVTTDDLPPEVPASDEHRTGPLPPVRVHSWITDSRLLAEFLLATLSPKVEVKVAVVG